MVSVEISSRALNFLVLQKRGRAFHITKAASFSCDEDIFAAPDTTFFARRIKDFLRAQKITETKACFALTHREIVFKEMLLPVMPAKEVENVVINDIEAGTRFASKKYLFNYRTYYLSELKKIRVLYYVVEKNIVDIAVKILQESGLRLASFSLTPLNLVDLPVERASIKNSAYIFLGYQISYVIFLRGKDCHEVYFVDWGLRQLTQDKIFSGQNFEDLAEELKRIIKSHEMQKDNTVCDFLLLWDNAQYPGLEKRLSTSLDRDPLSFLLTKNFFIDHCLQDKGFNLSFAPSLAAAHGTLCKKRYFDFLRIWNYQKTYDYKIKVVKRSVAFLILVTLFALKPSFDVYTKYKDELHQYFQLTHEFKDLKKKTVAFDQERQKDMEVKNMLLLQASVVSSLKKISWSEIFSAVTQAAPDNVWLASFELMRNGSITLAGRAMSLDSVANFIRNLKKKKNFCEVNLTSVGEVSFDNTIVHGFEINLRLTQEQGHDKAKN